MLFSEMDKNVTISDLIRLERRRCGTRIERTRRFENCIDHLLLSPELKTRLVAGGVAREVRSLGKKPVIMRRRGSGRRSGSTSLIRSKSFCTLSKGTLRPG